MSSKNNDKHEQNDEEENIQIIHLPSNLSQNQKKKHKKFKHPPPSSSQPSSLPPPPSSSILPPTYLPPSSSSFNPDQIPPDFAKAFLHQKAHLSRPDLDTHGPRCECCGFSIERGPMGICSRDRKFWFLGAGYPLFFSFICNCIVILLILLVISGIYNIAMNNRGDKCLSSLQIQRLMERSRENSAELSIDEIIKRSCEKTWITTSSLANRLDRDDEMVLQRWLNLGCVLVLIIYFQIFRRSQRKLENDCDVFLATPADFTVMVTNIKTGLDIDYDQELKLLFEKKAIPGKTSNIINVNLAYVLSDYFTLQSQKKNLLKKKREFPNTPNIEMQIKSFDSKIDSILEEFRVGRSKRFCGVAFVTFATEEQKLACLRERKESRWETIKGLLGRRNEEGRGRRGEEKWKREEERKRDADGGGRREEGEREDWRREEEGSNKEVKTKGKTKGLYFYGNKLSLRQAPEPSDVYWENLHFSLKERVLRKITGTLVSTMLLIGFSIGIYFLTWYQAEVNSKATRTEEGEKEDVQIKFIGAAISVCISIAIELLKTIIPMISHFEKARTRTDLETDVAIKLSFASFLTSSMITFFMTITYFDNYYGNGGLINNQTIIFLSNILVPPLMQLLNFSHLGKYLRRKLEERRGQASKMTQLEANELFELPPFSISKCYAQVIFTMFLATFYANVVPLGLFFSIISLILLYFTYKLNILYRNSAAFDVSDELSDAMLEILELTIVSFAASELIFTRLLFGWFPFPSILSICFAAFNLIFPSDWLNSIIFSFKVDVEKRKYEEVKRDFDEDYATCNPATMEMALEGKI